MPVTVLALAAGLWLLPSDDRRAVADKEHAVADKGHATDDKDRAHRRLAPADKERAAGTFDALGTALSALGITALVYGTILIPRDGWTDPTVLATLVAAAALLTGFVVRERRHPYPLVDLKLFTDRRFL